MSEIIVSVLDFIIKINTANPLETLFVLTLIGISLFYFLKIKPNQDKNEYEKNKRRDELEERRLNEGHKFNVEIQSNMVKQGEILSHIVTILNGVDKTLNDIHDTLLTHDARSKEINEENKRYHDIMPEKDDFDKIESKIEKIQHDIIEIKILINNNR